jgi:hypothetical protein
MNNIIKVSTFVASVAALTLAAQSARASSSSTTTSSATAASVEFDYRATCGAGSGLVVTNTSGKQIVVPSVLNVNPVMFVTTGAEIVGFNTYLPNDLITRRDDLIARIYSEKANGKLSDAQVDNLLAKVNDAANMPYSSEDESCVSHVKEVKHIYRRFDEVSNDILKQSKQGDRQLAGKYSYIVL